MNYSMSVTILSVLTIFLAILPKQSGERLPVFSGEYTLLNTSECAKDLDVYKPNTNGQWPAKIISSKYETFTNGTQTRLEITWRAEIKNVKGFKIVLNPSGKPDMCRILDYTDAITNSSSGLYSFKFRFNPIYKHRMFTAKLYPLPSRDNTSDLTSFNTVDCSNFAPSFTYDYDGRNMNITLTKGPALCKYKEYSTIVYVNKTNKIATKIIIPTQDNVDKLQAYFELNICKGYYYLLVSVYDRYFNDQSKCVCKDIRGLCRSCQNVKSKPVYLIPARSCSPKIVPPEEPEQNKVLFSLEIVIGLLLLTALALYITHWKLSVHLMVRKRGVVLLLDDHEHHTNAVIKLVNYLNECHLKVYLASTFLKNHDIPDQLVVISEALKSDFVLLILSPALQKRMEAWDKQQDYVEFFKEKNSNILTKALLEVLLGSNKMHVCKFDNVAEFGCWPKPCYSLPSDLTRMAADLNGQSFSQRLVLCNCLTSNSLWSELQTAIKKAIMYEQSHTNWFQEKYVCPTNVAVSYFMADETSRVESIGQSEYTNPQKLKEIFTGYKDTFTSLPEESITAPSIYSVPISEKLEAVNKRNL